MPEDVDLVKLDHPGQKSPSILPTETEDAPAAARRLRALGYTVLPLPARRKSPPPLGWVAAAKPYDIPPGANLAIATRGEIAILITNDDEATTWASQRYGPPHVASKRGGHWYFLARAGQVNEANRLTPVGSLEMHVGRNTEGKVAGKYALIPPSIHPDGNGATPLYRWVRQLPHRTELPEAPDLRDLFRPGGTHHAQLLALSAAAAHGGKDASAIESELRTWVAAHLPDPAAHPESELRGLAVSAVAKYGGAAPPTSAAPVAAAPAAPPPAEPPALEKFDGDRGELFRAQTDPGEETLGIAWVADGQIHATTLAAEMARIREDYEDAKDEEGRRAEQAAIRRLRESLPFWEPKEAYWALPEDPTRYSTSDWEAAHGPLLDAIRQYILDRCVLKDPDDATLLAIWVIAAAVRSPATEYAPRLLLEAPFGAGKTTLAEALLLLLPRGVSGAVLTPAAVYRTVDAWHVALLIDETAFENEDILRVVRSGFKAGAKIIRAAQRRDRGVVTVDPFGWAILTSQTDLKEDLLSRCYILRLAPGTAPKRVYSADPEATELRTVLTRLRLEVIAGTAYPDLAAQAAAGRDVPGVEPRSRDKLQPLYPFATHYQVLSLLIEAIARSDAETLSQLADSDAGLVVQAIARLLADYKGGLQGLRAEDLVVRRIQSKVEDILSEIGESTPISLGHGDVLQRIDLRRHGPRDFTIPILRKLGLRVKTVDGRARLDLTGFRAQWPSIVKRYGVDQKT